jgi:hypothetical protein
MYGLQEYIRLGDACDCRHAPDASADLDELPQLQLAVEPQHRQLRSCMQPSR